MNRKKFLQLCGIIFLICFAFIFSIENYNGFVFGDYIFSKLGIPTYTSGHTGIHYTLFVTLVLLIIGIFELRLFMLRQKINALKIISVFLVISFLYQPIYLFAYSRIKEHSKGLKAITYLRKDSKLEIRSEKINKTVEGTFRFKNFSKTEKRFYVNIFASNDKESINPNRNIKEDINFSELGNEVILPPKSEKTVILIKKANIVLSVLTSSTSYMSTNIDISIYNKKNSVNFLQYK